MIEKALRWSSAFNHKKTMRYSYRKFYFYTVAAPALQVQMSPPTATSTLRHRKCRVQDVGGNSFSLKSGETAPHQGHPILPVRQDWAH